MAFETGTASSLANLQTKIETFLTTTAGYTLTSGILTKTGTDIHVKFDNTENTRWLTLEMGKGSSAGSLLYKHPPWGNFSVTQRVGIVERLIDISPTMVFPINYDFQHLTANGEMFRCVVEYNNGYSQNIGFGEVVKAVEYAGGVYVDGSATYRKFNGEFMEDWIFGSGSSSINWQQTNTSTPSGQEGNIGLLPFGSADPDDANFQASTQLWAEVAGYDWYTISRINSDDSNFSGTKYANGSGTHDSLITSRFSDLEAGASLQAHNGNNTLVPIRLFGVAADGNYQRLGDVPDIRWTNIKNLNFGQVLDDGTDKWKTYPAFLKNAASLNGSQNPADSGQIGFAVRYDGP